MTTRKDVAALAGVSVATVSNVLNGTKKVTPDVEARVRKAVEELGYRPNLLARALATKQTRHVALVVDNLHNPHYYEVLEGAQAEASRNGYIVSVIAVKSTDSDEMYDLTRRGVDGLIMLLPVNDDRTEHIYKLGVPFVTGIDGLKIDYASGIDELVAALKQGGHRHVAYLSGLPIDNDRYRAFSASMGKYGLPVETALVVEGGTDVQTDEAEGAREMQKLLARKEKFTAVFTTNDLMAVGAIRALTIAGKRVPQDVSVVGCDRLKVFGSVTPTLASIDTQTYEIGRALMRALMRKIQNRECEKKVIVARYVPGESVAPVSENR